MLLEGLPGVKEAKAANPRDGEQLEYMYAAASVGHTLLGAGKETHWHYNNSHGA